VNFHSLGRVLEADFSEAAFALNYLSRENAVVIANAPACQCVARVDFRCHAIFFISGLLALRCDKFNKAPLIV